MLASRNRVTDWRIQSHQFEALTSMADIIRLDDVIDRLTEFGDRLLDQSGSRKPHVMSTSSKSFVLLTKTFVMDTKMVNSGTKSPNEVARRYCGFSPYIRRRTRQSIIRASEGEHNATVVFAFSCCCVAAYYTSTANIVTEPLAIFDR